MQRVLDFMTKFDLLCCPCVMVAPFDVDIRYAEHLEVFCTQHLHCLAASVEWQQACCESVLLSNSASVLCNSSHAFKPALCESMLLPDALQ